MKKLLKDNLLILGLCASIFGFGFLIHINPAVPFFLIILYLLFYKKFAKIKGANLTNLSFLFLVSFSLPLPLSMKKVVLVFH